MIVIEHSFVQLIEMTLFQTNGDSQLILTVPLPLFSIRKDKHITYLAALYTPYRNLYTIITMRATINLRKIRMNVCDEKFVIARHVGEKT